MKKEMEEEEKEEEKVEEEKIEEEEEKGKKSRIELIYAKRGLKIKMKERIGKKKRRREGRRGYMGR